MTLSIMYPSENYRISWTDEMIALLSATKSSSLVTSKVGKVTLCICAAWASWTADIWFWTELIRFTHNYPATKSKPDVCFASHVCEKQTWLAKPYTFFKWLLNRLFTLQEDSLDEIKKLTKNIENQIFLNLFFYFIFFLKH